MFIHAQSFEDLTACAEDEAQREALLDQSEGECAEELKALNVSTENKSKEEDVSSEAWRSHRKHVFVLSEAGKPIYTRYGTEEALSSTMGVMMALVSFVEAEKNIIRSIHAGQILIVSDMIEHEWAKCAVYVICSHVLSQMAVRWFSSLGVLWSWSACLGPVSQTRSCCGSCSTSTTRS